MTVSFQEGLTEADLEWLVSIGEKRTLSSKETLVEEQERLDQIYILLKGQLTSLLKPNQGTTLGRAYAALISEANTEQELFSYQEGEIFGEGSLLWTNTSPVTIQAKTEAIVVRVPCGQLQNYLKIDSSFAARFYRAIALLLRNRYELVLNQFLPRKRWQILSLPNRPIILEELHDHDLDWMFSHGKVESKKAGTVLIPAGEARETFYLVLKGLLSLTMTEKKARSLDQVFAKLTSATGETAVGQEIIRLPPREIVGETALLDSRPSQLAVQVLEDSALLAISRQHLWGQLQQQIAMSSRFYRVLTILFSERLLALIDCLRSRKNVGGGVTRYDQRN